MWFGCQQWSELSCYEDTIDLVRRGIILKFGSGYQETAIEMTPASGKSSLHREVES